MGPLPSPCRRAPAPRISCFALVPSLRWRATGPRHLSGSWRERPCRLLRFRLVIAAVGTTALRCRPLPPPLPCLRPRASVMHRRARSASAGLARAAPQLLSNFARVGCYVCAPAPSPLPQSASSTSSSRSCAFCPRWRSLTRRCGGCIACPAALPRVSFAVCVCVRPPDPIP